MQKKQENSRSCAKLLEICQDTTFMCSAFYSVCHTLHKEMTEKQNVCIFS